MRVCCLQRMFGNNYVVSNIPYVPLGKMNVLSLFFTGVSRLWNRYLNAASYVDSIIGEFIGELKRRNLYDGSVLIVTGDHGEEFGESGRFLHNSLFAFQIVYGIYSQYSSI